MEPSRIIRPKRMIQPDGSNFDFLKLFMENFKVEKNKYKVYNGWVTESTNESPPLDSHSWQGTNETLIYTSELKGRRLAPKQILKAGDLYMLLYQSQPIDELWGEVDYLQTSDVMFSFDLLNWYESPSNHIFDKILQPWQGDRAMAEYLVYEEDKERWVLFVTGNGTQFYTGLRAVGLFYSTDLLNWTAEPSNPVITVDNITDKGYGDIRIYCRGVHKVNGKWYMFVSHGKIGENYAGEVLVADQLSGPWTEIVNNPIVEPEAGKWDEQSTIIQTPIFHGNKWYVVYNNAFGGFGIATSDVIDAKWVKSPGNPIFDGYKMRGHSLLYPMPDGRWIILGENTSSQYGYEGLGYAITKS